MGRDNETGADRGASRAATQSSESNPMGPLLQQRLNLLVRLSASFAASRTGATPDEIPQLEQRTREQSELLTEWVKLEGQMQKEARREVQPATGHASDAERDLQPECARQHQLLLEIQRRCGFEMAVLRRARRTAGALRALLSMQDPTYTAAEPI